LWKVGDVVEKKKKLLNRRNCGNVEFMGMKDGFRGKEIAIKMVLLEGHV